jgi:hypothetical protein
MNAEKFKDFTDDRTCNKRWVCVKGKTPVLPGTDKPVEWRDIKNRYSWQQVQMIPAEGYGIILDKTGLCCIDFDKCLADSGIIAVGEVSDLLSKLNTWTEISQSGTGLHAWLITDAGTRNRKPGGCFELIADGHVRVTGKSFPQYADKPIQMIDGAVLTRLLNISGPVKAPAQKKIPEGARNDTLFKMGASLRAKGLSEPAIRAALVEENRLCTPPLPDHEISRIAASAGSYAPGGEPVHKDPLTETKAVEILTTGEPMEYFVKEYRQRHIGDELVMRLIALVSCCQVCEHSFGIHPALDGVRGSGKSSAVAAALSLLPPEFIYNGTFSAKALHYADLKPGTIIFSDDTLPNEDLIDVMKRSMSSFHDPVMHLTLSKNRDSLVVSIPPECVFILTSVGLSSDDQLRDRQVVIPIDKNPELDRQYVDYLNTRALTGTTNEITPDLEICRQIMRIIKENRYRVVVPFANRIQFSPEAMGNRRAMNNFYDYLWASAILFHRQREHKKMDGYVEVTAAIDDFTRAQTMFPRSESVWDLKLSKREQQVYQMIAGSPGIQESEITKKLGMDKGYVHRLLHGDPHRSLAGLKDKAPVDYVREYNKDSGRQANIWTITRRLKEGIFDFVSLVDGSTT